MPRRRTRTDEILDELLNDPEPERPPRGHELIRMAYMGRIPPGEYRYEREFMDGRIEIETFEADAEGRVKNLKIWVEEPESAESKPKRLGKRAHPTAATKRKSGKRGYCRFAVGHYFLRRGVRANSLLIRKPGSGDSCWSLR